MEACQWERCIVCDFKLSLLQTGSFQDVALDQGKAQFDSQVQSSESNKWSLIFFLNYSS